MIGKTSLVAAIRSHVPELPRQDAAVVEAFFAAIAGVFVRGQTVVLGLGHSES
jgi:hypothetical protein